MKKFSMILMVVLVLGLIAIPAFGFGGYGIGGFGGGMMSTVSDDDFAKWLQDQVDDGWMTQKQADYILDRHTSRTQIQTEEDYYAYIDQQVQDGWLTEKQAAALKENYAQFKERFGENATFGQFGGMSGFCPYLQNGTTGFGPMGGIGRGGFNGGARGGMRGGRW